MLRELSNALKKLATGQICQQGLFNLPTEVAKVTNEIAKFRQKGLLLTTMSLTFRDRMLSKLVHLVSHVAIETIDDFEI